MLTLLLLLPCIVATGLFDPLSYDVTFRIPNEVEPSGSFSASLDIHLDLPQDTTTLVLDAVDLSAFRNVTLIDFAQPGRKHELKGIRIMAEHVEFIFDELARGEYVLHIGEYIGTIQDGSTGLFVRGASVYTHLQPSYARRLLPCIDRPSVRTPFRVTIEHSQNTLAFSNTASVEERTTMDSTGVDGASRKRTTFSTTPALPAYLLAISVLPDSLHQLSASTSFGVTVRVLSFKQTSLLRVLRAALATFEYLADVIKIPLPINKLDLVLVEGYEGGMENWGHILLSSALADTADDAHLLHIVAHEIAHHWVGNAATVRTWAHICLQEDLTELLAHKAVRQLLPREDFERFRLAKYVEIQLAEDIVSPNHPLILPEEITNQMIWTHCYLKGVIILEQVESLIGEPAMMEIIRALVSGTSAFDLTSFASHLAEHPVEGNVTLADVYYHAFTHGGYPTIDVKVEEKSLKIAQSAPSLWPLLLPLADGRRQWMLTSSASIPRSNASLISNSKKTWNIGDASLESALVNVNFTSFVRVNYDDATWAKIIDRLDESPASFTPVGRAQLLSDLCYFSHGGFIDRALVDRAMAIVYAQPRYFDLCDWTLLWCRNSMEISASSLLQRALINMSTFFTTASDYKCRSGEAILAVNQLCRKLFGKDCI